MQKSYRLIGCLSGSLLIAGCVNSQQGFVDNASNLKDVQVCRNYLADKKDLYAVSDDEKASIAGYSAALQREFFRRGLTETKCEGLVKDHNDKVAAGVAAAVVIGAITYVVVKDAKECDADPKCRRSGGGGFSSARNSNNQTERARRGQPETAFKGAYAWDYYYDANGNEVKRCRSTETGQSSNNASCLLSPKNDATWPEKQINVSSDANGPYLSGQDGIVGGSMCRYSDGSVVKISGSYCPRRNTISTDAIPEMDKVRINGPYLTGQDGIVGGSLCKYSDGSVKKVLGSMCPRSN